MMGLSCMEWVGIVAQILMATIAAFSLSRFIPWSCASYQARLPFFFNGALAPLILGISVIGVIAILPGATHQTHILATNILLMGLILIGRLARKPSHFQPSSAPYHWYDRVLIFLLFFWILSLFHDVIFLPLTKNDALEYASVGKILFEKRTLLAYPVLDSTNNNSGFYGPWTHPPLYVALIYFANILQGTADLPLLMRIISPWFTLGATGIVYALGRIQNKTIGLLSALLFLSCPLNFLGSSSSLIDPLPILGMALILASLVGITGPYWQKGLIQGLVLGLALWTHSEAILFIPLTLVAIFAFNGLKSLRQSLSQSAFLLISAFCVSFWPYLRNIKLFGSPIHDNPLIFKLPSLDWQGYFDLSRGIDTFLNKIQYGLFKGWFVIDAYSFLFWSMTVGILFYGLKLIREKNLCKVLCGDPSLLTERTYFTFFIIILSYLGGVLVSIFLDIDLMIRNERYQLIIIPLVALFSGYGIHVLISQILGIPSSLKKFSVQRIFALFVSWSFFAVMILQLAALKLNAWSSMELSFNKMPVSLEDKLERIPCFQAMTYLRDKTDAHALVLSMKPSDMFYAHRRMISYLDPQLVDFYGEKDVDKAYHLLLQQGVNYIHIPSYALPPFYNSALHDIVSNPQYAQLVFSSQGHQIFHIARPSQDKFCDYQSLAPGEVPWTKKTNFIIGGRKAYWRLPTKSEILRNSPLDFSIIPRENSIFLWSSVDNDLTTYIRVDGDREYRLTFNLIGKGFITFYLMELDKDGKIIGTYTLDEMPLNAQKNARDYHKRMVTSKEASFVRLGVETRGNSNFRIQKIALESLCHSF